MTNLVYSGRGDASDDSDEIEEAAPKTEGKSEFQWVQLYMGLNKLLMCLGYEKQITLETAPDESDPKVFSLDSIILSQVLQSREPQVLSHLL